MATINSIGSNKPIEVAFGGTGAATLTGVLTGNGTSAVTANAVTQHGVLVAGASNAVSSLTVGTNGQVLVGSTGADPVMATLTTDSSPATIAYTTGAGTLQIKVNQATKITTFTGNNTFTIDPRTQWVTVIAVSSGGGGGSGRKGASGAAGGGGGGSGSWGYIWNSPGSAFNPAGESVTVGGTANGGLAQTTDSTDGNIGSTQNKSGLGNQLVGGINTGGNGGTNGTISGGLASRWVVDSAQVTLVAGSNGVLGNPSNVTAIFSPYVGTSAGAGGGANTAAASQGSSGGNITSLDNSITILAAAAGGIETGTIDGSTGNSAVTSTAGIVTGGGGGGGGGGQKTAGAGRQSGQGGDGAIPGGGGGGSGGALNTTDATGGSKRGGNGARGQVVVIEYF